MENTLSFSTHGAPEPKKISFSKVISVVRKIGNVAGRISDITGKVALIATIV